jgi:DNA repair photolyase
MTSLDDDHSRRWEPYAALPAERIATQRAFHEAGIYTWTSLEPVLDIEASLAIIRATHRFVDLFKCGRLNYGGKLKTPEDWRVYTHRLVAELARVNASAYVKADLQPFLPVGYPNPMRVSQHH